MAPINTAGEDGFFLKGGTPGVDDDVTHAFNSTSTLTPVATGNVHRLIPTISSTKNPPQEELGRNSYENPGLMFNDLALEGVAIPSFERVLYLVLRAEVQDFANHNNINILNSAVTNVGLSTYMNTQERHAGRRPDHGTLGRDHLLVFPFLYDAGGPRAPASFFMMFPFLPSFTRDASSQPLY